MNRSYCTVSCIGPISSKIRTSVILTVMFSAVTFVAVYRLDLTALNLYNPFKPRMGQLDFIRVSTLGADFRSLTTKPQVTAQIDLKNRTVLALKMNYSLSSPTSEVIKADNTIHCQQRTLVYICCKNCECGGWGDRQRGMVSVFLLSQLLNRTFAIIHEKPCLFSDLLQPNLYNWSKCDLSKHKGYLSNFNILSMLSSEFAKQIPNITDLDQHFPGDISYVTSNQRWIEGLQKHPKTEHMVPWILNESYIDVFSKVINILFKPKPLLRTQLADFRQKYKGFYIVCAQVRMGRNPDNPSDEIARMGIPNVTVIKKFLTQFNDTNKYKLYIASDSSLMKSEMKQSFGPQIIDLGLTIVHVDQFGRNPKVKENKVSPCVGLHDAIFEQQILSQCDTLLVTRSGFGVNAAYLRNWSSALFCYVHQNQTIIPCSKKDLTVIYNGL